MKPIQEFLSHIPRFKIDKSKIHGKGIICTHPIRCGDDIGTVADNKEITRDFGRWVNHCRMPNGELQKRGRLYVLVAVKDIEPGEEITGNYDETPDFLSKADPSWD